MTLINTQLNSLLGLQSFTQSSTPPNDVSSTASTRAEQNILEKSTALQRITALTSQQFALRDSSNAIEFIQLTDAALSKTTSGLLELRLLAQQSSILTLTSTQRSQLVVQTNAIKSELNSIASGTIINGKNILDGSIDKVSFQIGATSDQTISIRGFKADTTALGSLPGVFQSTSNRVQLSDRLTGTQGIQEGNALTSDINQLSILISASESQTGINIAKTEFGGPIKTISNTDKLTNRGSNEFGGGLAKSVAERINAIRNTGEQHFSGIIATAMTQFQSSEITSDDFSGTVDTSKNTSIGAGKLQARDLLINGVDIGALIVTNNDSSGGLVRAINDKSDITGVFAAVDSSGILQLSAFDGRDIVISTSSTGVTNTLFGAGDNRFSNQFSNLRISGRVTLSGDQFQTFFGADIFQSGFNNLKNLGASDNTASLQTIYTTDLGNAASAQNARDVIDSALSQVASYRTELMAIQKNILQSTLDPLKRIRSALDAQTLANQTNILVTRQAPIATISQANITATQTVSLLS